METTEKVVKNKFCPPFRDEKYYYSQPWEYGADLFGGVTGRNYTEKAAEKFLIYWENIFN